MANMRLPARARTRIFTSPFSAATFDRSFILAVIYPMVSISIIWSATNTGGRLQEEFQLPTHASLSERIFVLISQLIFIALAIPIDINKPTHLLKLNITDARLFLIATLSIMDAFIESGSKYFFIPLSITFAASNLLVLKIYGRGTIRFSGAALLTGILVFGVLTHIILSTYDSISHDSLTVITINGLTLGIGLGVFTGVIVTFATILQEYFTGRQAQGIFLLIFTLAMIMAHLIFARALSSLPTWKFTGPQLFFIGLITLVNAPFDALSIAITRLLMSRGILLKGWWPVVLALLDIALAVLIVTLLVPTMTIITQAYDLMATRGGGSPVICLPELLDMMSKNPLSAQFYWIVCVIFSTMIPSLMNVVVGAMSLIRGLPGLSSFVVRRARSADSELTQIWVAIILAIQRVFAICIGVIALAFVLWILFGAVLPMLGLGLLELARETAALNIPAHFL